jgi:putative transposase
MQQIEPLGYNNYYHIYNRGINSCELFKEGTNYTYFLGLYEKYIVPVADTFAWVLMPNHFHLLVRVKEEKEIAVMANSPDRVQNPVRAGIPSQQFSKLFNSYAQAFNRRNKRHGCLFERPFKRKAITNEDYLKQLVVYIHNNPVHHGFCVHPEEYPWSSYQTCLSDKSTKLRRNEVIDWFEDLANFKYVHEEKLEMENIEQWLEI